MEVRYITSVKEMSEAFGTPCGFDAALFPDYYLFNCVNPPQMLSVVRVHPDHASEINYDRAMEIIK